MRYFFFLIILSVPLHSYSLGTWVQRANLGGVARYGAVGFSIGNKGYIGTGEDAGNYLQDFWEWDQATNVWTQKANFAGAGRYLAAGFSIGTKGYIGIGFNPPSYPNDFWEWDQATNVWTQKANFAGAGTMVALGFSIGNKGYIGTGDNTTNGLASDFWEWDQATNVWTRKANFGGTGRYEAAGFSIGAKCYIGTGYENNGVTKDFWEWDQSTNVWTQKANFPGTAREGAVGFAIGNFGYMGLGWAHDAAPYYKDYYQYDPSNNQWTQQANFTGTGRDIAVGFSIGCKGYIGTGQNPFESQDFWEFSPANNIVANINSSASTICSGQIVTLTASGGVNYSWNTGATSASIIITPTSNTTYSVSVLSGTCSADTNIIIAVFTNPSATVSGNLTIFQGQSTTLSASGGGNYLWSSGETTTAISVTPSVTTVYCVTVADTNNCKNSTCATVTIESPCDTAGTFFFPNAFSPNNDGENDVLKIYYGNMDCIKSLQLLIYDRWGEQVYETIDPNFSWDGTYQNKTLITQVLAYHLSVGFTDGKAIDRKGNISLVR